ncbi:MAG: hypothetical protein HY690_04200 [Chloroflexi bacterium]|nr:hypothetical protein [Chloroflexota bacterium]
MDLDRLAKDLGAHKKAVTLAAQLLADVASLEKNPADNLPQLQDRLRKLDAAASQLVEGPRRADELRSWVAEQLERLEAVEQERSQRFGLELSEALAPLGLTLAGLSPDLHAGLFTIELRFDQGHAVLWYGPKQERLAECKLSAADVANSVERAREQLGSPRPEAEFLQRLREAYSRVAGSKASDPVPIVDLLPEVAFLVQGPRFRQDPRAANFKDYGRADFSYDLFCLGRAPGGSFDHLPRLTVAVRKYTSQRADFLWVPDDESGKGTTYSHLCFPGPGR